MKLLAVVLRRLLVLMRALLSFTRKSYFRLAYYPHCTFGTGVSMGRGVRIAVTDGGRLTVGARTCIGARASLVVKHGTLSLGESVHIGEGCVIAARESVNIGEHSMLAEYVSVRDHDHGMAPGTVPFRQQPFTCAPIRIGTNVWIAARVAILAGATIGDDVVIGANSVINGEIPSRTLAVGAPARVLRSLGT